jgi:hypothetical protein
MERHRRKEEEMRRSMAIVVLALVILGGVALGIGAYNAGVAHGLAQGDHAVQVIREVRPGFGFPFGLLLFPLFFFLVFEGIRGAMWGRRWGGGHGHGGPQPWMKEGAARFDDWHRRAHEQDAGDHPGAGGEPAQV